MEKRDTLELVSLFYVDGMLNFNGKTMDWSVFSWGDGGSVATHGNR